MIENIQDHQEEIVPVNTPNEFPYGEGEGGDENLPAAVADELIKLPEQVLVFVPVDIPIEVLPINILSK